jgi:hypothetical protein
MTDGAIDGRPVLRGSLVTIRPGGRDDVPLLRAVLSEESVTRWWGSPRKPRTSRPASPATGRACCS